MLEPDQYILDLPELQERDAPTFDNFIAGVNGQALAVIREMAQDRGPRFLYLHGPMGVGLTHLLTAFDPEGMRAGERVPAFDGRKRRYAVDDIDLLDDSAAAELLALQENVYASEGARLVCAAHCPLHALRLPEAVKSRLQSGLIYAVEPLNEADRFRELRRLAALRGMTLTRDMEAWMSLHLPRDMRTLTRVLDVVNQLSLHDKRRVTLGLIREAAALTIDSVGEDQRFEAAEALLKDRAEQ